MTISGVSPAELSAQQATAMQETLQQQLQDAINSDNGGLIRSLGTQLGLSSADISSLQKDAALLGSGMTLQSKLQDAQEQLDSDTKKLAYVRQHPNSPDYEEQLSNLESQVANDQTTVSAGQNIMDILGSIK